MEKWRNGILICLVERKKNERMENKVSINLQLYPY